MDRSIILPSGESWTDLKIWTVDPQYVDSEDGNVKSSFRRWCKDNFTHDWHFEWCQKNGWKLVVTSPDDWMLLRLKYL